MNLILLIILAIIIFELLKLRRRVAMLEKRQQDMQSEAAEFDRADGRKHRAYKDANQEPPRDAPTRKDEWATQNVKERREKPSSVPASSAPAAQAVQAKPVQPMFSEPKETAFGKYLEAGVRYLKDFFTTGNVVLKVGIIILFFGVSFLLKYAAQRNMIPIEFRLAGVALGGISLVTAGWVLAKKRAGFGLVLQGGGIGILYLTVFAAAKLYGLLPNTLSFFIMFGLVVLSGVLAVIQDTKALAAFGAGGGFLAPVLMSTGTGSHVMLFSYYALLNSGIVGIAWFKAWRELNLLGFFFTFVISAFWGYRYYQPAYFATTEPFLLLFFVFYFVISILFAHRQPLHLRGFVDGPLVFGLPIVFFGMQASLVENLEYGVAFSALGLGGFYVLAASLLWKRLVEGMRILTEAFLALGIVFGSLAIPFALNGPATASAWALEGGAMVWVGLRQKRILARNFGILLQIGAAISYISNYGYMSPDTMIFFNELTLGGIFIALGSLFSSFHLSRHKTELKAWEGFFHLILLAWGIVWWLVVIMIDIEHHAGYPQTKSYILLFVSFTALLLGAANRKLAWQELKYPLFGFLPILVFAALADFELYSSVFYFKGMGLAAWSISLVVLWFTLRLMEGQWGRKSISIQHMVSLWLLIFLLTHDTAQLVEKVVAGTPVWSFVCLAMVPGLFIIALLGAGEKIVWPVATHRRSYLDWGIVPPLLFLVFWSIISNFRPGDPAPLPFIPLLNPLALSQIFVFLVILFWLKYNLKSPGDVYQRIPVKDLWICLGGLVFFWLNGLTARLVHNYFDIPFTFHSLFDSVIMQSAVSILWSILALTVTVWANRKGIREIWFGGAVLLTGVVLKLFLVDLSGTGTIARIVSFLAVGALMLLIGYFSPLPPKSKETVT